MCVCLFCVCVSVPLAIYIFVYVGDYLVGCVSAYFVRIGDGLCIRLCFVKCDANRLES